MPQEETRSEDSTEGSNGGEDTIVVTGTRIAQDTSSTSAITTVVAVGNGAPRGILEVPITAVFTVAILGVLLLIGFFRIPIHNSPIGVITRSANLIVACIMLGMVAVYLGAFFGILPGDSNPAHR